MLSGERPKPEWLASFCVGVCRLSFQNGIQVLLCEPAASVFQLSWFHKLVRQTFTCDQLAMPRGVCGDNCVVYLSWIVSALTLAEWMAFTYVLVLLP